MPLAAGQTLAWYEILGPLGSGAMGEVYRARDTRLRREVAIKVLSSELACGSERLLRDLGSRVPFWPHMLALSPDDLWLATPLRDEGTTNLWILATTDGELHQVTDFGRRATMIARQVSWSSDSRYLFAAVMETDADADIVLLEGALE